MLKKTTLLKNLIYSPQLSFLMEAHNGLSARIVEEAGFKGIWASGLCLSASMGVRDNNEASWTQVLEILEFMSDSTHIPILMDGDTGFGNFNNLRRLVSKLEQRGIAGVCIEDKLFPKTNSFIQSKTQPLTDSEEFCGKIKAAKDTQTDPDFMVVARTEAFITGQGLAEAFRRADAYRQAGADAILVHSPKSNLSDIESFIREWGQRLPVIIVPTKYYSIPTKRFRDLGISTVIWANQNLRAATLAMQKVSHHIFETEQLITIEDQISPIEEIFRLQNADELIEAEKKYLPTHEQRVSSIILAESLINPDTLAQSILFPRLKLDGIPSLLHQVDTYHHLKINTITIVPGSGFNLISTEDLTIVDNDSSVSGGELYSLYLALDHITDNTIVSSGNILFKPYLLKDLIEAPQPLVMIVDPDYEHPSHPFYFAVTDKPYSRMTSFLDEVRLKEISERIPDTQIGGQFIGLWKIGKGGVAVVREAIDRLSRSMEFRSMSLSQMFNEIVKIFSVTVKFTRGGWLDSHSISDIH